MDLVDRVRNILVTPKTEWVVIAGEPTPAAALVKGYVLPLAAVAAAATFIGTVFVGAALGSFGMHRASFAQGLVMLVLQVAMAVATVFVVGVIIDALAPHFGAQKNPAQALKAAVYSFTPVWVAGLLGVLPSLATLAVLGIIYGAYVMFLGLPVLMKSPEDRTTGYTLAIFVATVIVMVILNGLAGLAAAPALYGAAVR